MMHGEWRKNALQRPESLEPCGIIGGSAGRPDGLEGEGPRDPRSNCVMTAGGV